jgi:hypothetical protein
MKILSSSFSYEALFMIRIGLWLSWSIVRIYQTPVSKIVVKHSLVSVPSKSGGSFLNICSVLAGLTTTCVTMSTKQFPHLIPYPVQWIISEYRPFFPILFSRIVDGCIIFCGKEEAKLHPLIITTARSLSNIIYIPRIRPPSQGIGASLRQLTFAWVIQ